MLALALGGVLVGSVAASADGFTIGVTNGAITTDSTTIVFGGSKDLGGVLHDAKVSLDGGAPVDVTSSCSGTDSESGAWTCTYDVSSLTLVASTNNYVFAQEDLSASTLDGGPTSFEISDASPPPPAPSGDGFVIDPIPDFHQSDALHFSGEKQSTPAITDVVLKLNGGDANSVNGGADVGLSWNTAGADCDFGATTWTCDYAPGSAFQVTDNNELWITVDNSGDVNTHKEPFHIIPDPTPPDPFTVSIWNSPLSTSSHQVYFGGDKSPDTEITAVDVMINGTDHFVEVSYPACSGVGFDDTSWDCSYYDDSNFPAGTNNLISVSLGEAGTRTLPFVIYDGTKYPDYGSGFSAAAATFAATPTAPGTLVWMGLDTVICTEGCDFEPFTGTVEDPQTRCPDFQFTEGGPSASPEPGSQYCYWHDLPAGDYNFWAIQDIGDGITPSYDSWQNDFFRVPNAPQITSVSVSPSGAVSVSGGSDWSTYEGDGTQNSPGDLIGLKEYDGHTYTELTCGPNADFIFATPGTGAWSCPDLRVLHFPGGDARPVGLPLAIGQHHVVGLASDYGAGYYNCWDFCTYSDPHNIYLGLGTSAYGNVSTFTLAAVPTGGTTTPGSTTPGTTNTTPTWTFEITGLDFGNVHPGDSFTITGAGLPPGADLTFELHSTPVQLAHTTVAGDGSFSVTGTIPLDALPGDHHIVATLSGTGINTTTKDQAITVVAPSNQIAQSSGGTSPSTTTHQTTGSTDASGTLQPNILTHGLSTIADVVAHPNKITAAFAIGLVLLIFAIFPAHLLNATIAEQYERFQRRRPEKGARLGWWARFTAWLDRTPIAGGLLITSATAFLFGFADPKFGLTLASLRLFLAGAIALFVVVYLSNAIAGWVVRRNWHVNVVVNIRPLGLILTIVGVIVSRLLDFSPGFLIGLVLGLTIAGKSAAEHAWKAVLIRSGIVLGVATIAWLCFSAFTVGSEHHETFGNALFLETLVAITTEGTVVLLVELLPIKLLEGERLYQKSRPLWAIVYLLFIVLFVVAVVPWEGNWAALGSSLWGWITGVVGFGAVCTAIYLYFRFVAKPLHEEHEEPKELVDISDQQ